MGPVAAPRPVERAGGRTRRCAMHIWCPKFRRCQRGRPKRFAHFLIVGILALGADWQHEDCIGLAELEPGLLSVITGPQAVEVAGALVLGVAIAAMHSRRCGSTLGRLSFDAKGDVAGLAPFAWSGWTDGTYVPHDITDW
jgi:hypothetical protein